MAEGLHCHVHPEQVQLMGTLSFNPDQFGVCFEGLELGVRQICNLFTIEHLRISRTERLLPRILTVSLAVEVSSCNVEVTRILDRHSVARDEIKQEIRFDE